MTTPRPAVVVTDPSQPCRINIGSAKAIALLAGNGNLVKRPFALGSGAGAGGVGLAGFDEAAWTAALADRAGRPAIP
jgi:hypothetical protein